MSSPINAGAVIYAKDTSHIAAFYAQVMGFRITHSDAEYAVLESVGFQLIIHAIPPEIAASIAIANPPVRREDSAVKLIFSVASINDARTLAAEAGGELNPPEREWQFQGDRVCDGHDPEGNVIQLRERLR